MLNLTLAMGRWPLTERRVRPQFALKRRSEGEGGRQVGKISFIDLAGSERGADTYDNDRRAPLVALLMPRNLASCVRLRHAALCRL